MISIRKNQTSKLIIYRADLEVSGVAVIELELDATGDKVQIAGIDTTPAEDWFTFEIVETNSPNAAAGEVELEEGAGEYTLRLFDLAAFPGNTSGLAAKYTEKAVS